MMLAAANVLAVYATSAGYWSVVPRPLALSIVAAAAITMLILVVVRRIDRAVGVSCFVVLLIAGHPVGLLGAILLAGWAVRNQLRSVRGAERLTFPAQQAFGFSAAITALALVSALVGGAVAPSDIALPQAAAARASEPGGSSIYIVMLDAYPRADTLQESLGFDNSPFTDSLGDLGFTVSGDATSPTTRTERTILSMFTVPGGSISPEAPGWRPADDPTIRRETRRLLARAQGPRLFRDAGYHLVRVASPVIHTEIDGWDVQIDTGQVNELEAVLLQRSPILGPLSGGWVLDQQRERIIASLDAVAGRARDASAQLVFAHIMSPHPPLVFGGGTMPACWTEGCALWGYQPGSTGFDRNYAASYLANLQGLNEHVLATINHVVSADPEATVVVMSDHGGRFNEDSEEWQRSFLAARGTAVFDEGPTVANLLYRLAVERGLVTE
jgi:hypothetical protein